MNSWDVFTGAPVLPPGALAELAALRAALPGYDVIITSHRRIHRFEATRRGNGPGPWCLISGDPAYLRRELADRARPAALDGDPLDRGQGADHPMSKPTQFARLEAEARKAAQRVAEGSAAAEAYDSTGTEFCQQMGE